MSMGVVISIVVALLSSLLCAVVAFFFFCLIIGVILLRRRGRKNVTAKEAVKHGVETVSMVFRRGQDGDLVAVTHGEDDDDDDAGEAEKPEA